MDLTALVSVLLVLAVIGLVVYLIVTYIPMPQPFKIVIYAVAAIALILWVLKSFPLKF
jgi:hypothetical protein